MISAIVLAAGKSSRMGEENKMLLPFRKTTIIGAVITALSNSIVDEIIIVDKQLSNVGEQIENNDSIKYVTNKDAARGLTTSIQCGVRTASPTTSGYLICLGDMPLLTFKEYNLLINKFIAINNKAIMIPTHDNKRGNPVLFSQHFKKDIMLLLDTNGCKPLVTKYQECVREVNFSTNHCHIDIDTIEDYNRIT